MLALLFIVPITDESVDLGSAMDWTQVLISAIATFGVIAAAAFSYLGNKAAKAAKAANTADHGEVLAEIKALSGRVDDVAKGIDNVNANVGNLSDRFVNHLEHHLTKESTS